MLLLVLRDDASCRYRDFCASSSKLAIFNLKPATDMGKILSNIIYRLQIKKKESF